MRKTNSDKETGKGQLVYIIYNIRVGLYHLCLRCFSKLHDGDQSKNFIIIYFQKF